MMKNIAFWITGLITLLFISSCHNQPFIHSNTPAPSHIALLLPLHGTLHEQGDAIKNGFLHEFYREKQTSRYAPEIYIYDTTNTSIITLYQQALQEGAQAIVGPLLKTDVDALVKQQKFTVPTLVLNAAPRTKDYLYPLHFSSTADIVETAEWMKQRQHKRVLVMLSEDPVSQHMGTVFHETWRDMHGEIVDTLVYHPNTSLAESVRDFLKLPKEIKRHQAPHPREDFDCIFLATPPTIARQIVPLLRFYGITTRRPIYSTPMIYNGHPDPTNDEDIDGVIFADIPWPHLSSAPDDTAYPGRYPRLYALGIDAYRVVTHLYRTQISGATGMLFLQMDGTIKRKPTWVYMNHGSLEAIPGNY